MDDVMWEDDQAISPESFVPAPQLRVGSSAIISALLLLYYFRTLSTVLLGITS